MSNDIKVGVIGTSWFADEIHLPSLTSHPNAQIEAICGRNRVRLEEMAKKYEIPQCFTDFHEMIENGGIDAIVIVSPEDLHYQMTMAALEARLHVFCEKALALNSEDGKTMYYEAEEVGVKHMINFTYRWFPCFRYLKQLLNQDYIGDVYDVTVQYWANYGRSDDLTWRFDGNRSNGALSDLGSHMIDLVHWLVGDIVEVGATLNNFVARKHPANEPFESVNDTAFLSIKLANGAVGTISTSAVSVTADRVQEQIIILHGKEGTLECKYSFEGSDFVAGKMVTPFEIKGSREGLQKFELLTVPDSIWGDADRTNMFLRPSRPPLLPLFRRRWPGRRYVQRL